MALATQDNSATISTTEYFLASNSTTKTDQTTHCYLQVWIDFGALAAGDEYRVRIYEKVTPSSTQRVIAEAYVAGPQIGPWVSPSLHVRHGWEVGVVRTAGTDRTIAWSLRRAD